MTAYSPDDALQEIVALLAQGYLRHVKDRRLAGIPGNGAPVEELKPFARVKLIVIAKRSVHAPGVNASASTTPNGSVLKFNQVKAFFDSICADRLRLKASDPV